MPNQMQEGTRSKSQAGRSGLLLAGIAAFSLLGGGCTRTFGFQPVSMWNESRLKPFEPSPLSAGGSSARMPPTGSVARGQLAASDPLYSGREGKALLIKSPIPVTPEMLTRGQSRFNVYCYPCHGPLGDGNGMIVSRGFPHPPDYALKRLHEAPVGHFYDVITNGYGVMYSYAERVPVTDRWAIASYIRVLQSRRPMTTVDPYEAERKRARDAAIPDPNRGIRMPGADGAVPAVVPGGTPAGKHAPSPGQPSGTAPGHGPGDGHGH